jgi:hypothetical protein
MRFPMPHFPCEFEIPDAWLSEAGAAGFTPTRSAFRSGPSAMDVLLTAVEPPPRLIGYPLSWRGLDRVRFVRVLKGIVEDVEIEAVPVLPMPFVDLGPSPYEFRIRDGVHRFYASVAMGFSHLPVDPSL